MTKQKHSKYFTDIVEFLIKHTKGFDSSHDSYHGFMVYKTTKKILEYERLNNNKIDYDIDTATTVSLLHDVRDHKYENCVSQEEFDKFLDDRVGSNQRDVINLMIQSISWSKRNKNPTLDEELAKKLSVQHMHILKAVRDADLIEAIGKKGILRCETFVIAQSNSENMKEVPQKVVQHAKDKLIKLYPDNWISTKCGRSIAEPLHKEMMSFLENYNGSNKWASMIIIDFD